MTGQITEKGRSAPGAGKSLFSLWRPSDATVELALKEQHQAPLSYGRVGATRRDLPKDMDTDCQTVVLGMGRGCFESARHALESWTQFDLAWVWPVSTTVPLREGELFAFRSRSLGVWSLNVCRVVYVIDEKGPDEWRFGFAYGTVGVHAVRGEERFLLRWDRRTDEVEFEISKFSTPAHPLLIAFGPVTRWIQGRFTRDALARLATEVCS